jgi:hypothetical protein
VTADVSAIERVETAGDARLRAADLGPAVYAARYAGHSWDEIAAAAGMTRDAVRMAYRREARRRIS